MMQQIGQGQSLQQRGIGFMDALEGGLGLRDDTAFNEGFNRFQNASGFRNIQDQAMRGVAGSAAARGLLGSGATLRAMQDRSANLANQSYQNYLGMLMNQQGQAFEASQSAFGTAQGFGNAIAGAGQT
ncbi:hypothetical protein RZS08_21820, partial [Arthrospira platensis SPKY1]|nr:hypothetical protein [Arthrospira platensis SPKY1]